MNTIAMLALAGLVLSVPPANADTASAPKPGAEEKSAKAAAGKPGLPMTIESSVEGTIEADRDLPLTITLTPRKRCQELTTQIRGIDGIVVKSEATSHACSRNTPVRHAAMVRAPAGVAGSVVVDVTMVLRGKKVSTSKAFQIAAPGATPKPATIGRPGIGAHGQPLILLEPQQKR